jgi:ectoine hydroxylase-related dioxygenase (phytanoyl-CoA dioxygenase family)
MLHPVIDELMGHLLGPDFLLSSLTANIARPGGDNMGLHTDQGYVGFWTPVPAVANIAWMLDDFTADNGGTRLVPRSHRFALDGSPRASDTPLTPEQIPNQSHTIGAEGAAGSILCFDGRVFHGTGANRSDRQRHALLSYHCRPWVRTQENSTLGLDPAIRVAERPELLHRLGFKVWAGLGRVEASAANATLHLASGAIPALKGDGALLTEGA